jgi:hypothetical protein
LWSSYDSGKYAEDLKETIRVLAARDVTLYMFTNPNSGVSRRQFGDPACDRSNADFSNFQRQATIDCLAAAGLSPSLVGALLSRGKLARNFDVDDRASCRTSSSTPCATSPSASARRAAPGGRQLRAVQVLVDARLLHRVHVRHRL